MFFEPRIVM